MNLELPPVPRTSKAQPVQRTLIDQLLDEQKKLQTPVARFSETHHHRKPDLSDHYRTLIPLTKPAQDEQYAFEVSLDRCTGCKACVSACHSLNGLDEDETWRDIGLIHDGDDRAGFQQTITTACHHCGDPACLDGCPVGAYEKEPETGIVRHLDDQCIGCSYCILKCPYDVPKYSKKRGIVRKCDMCHQRLAEGEAPACVQACPTEAIRIVKVPRIPITPLLPSLILGNPSITRPTTRYIGRSIPDRIRAADRDVLTPQHAHWPLILMLTFTQAGIGLLGVAALTSSPHSLALLLTATIIFFCGMAASVLHLGQPLKAWRFFLGLRTSWLSREILTFSMFAPIPCVLIALHLTPDFPFKREISQMTSYSVFPLGLLAVFTSVMIYVDTHRISWRFSLTSTRFFGTLATFAALGSSISDASPFSTGLLIFTVLLKMIPEARILRKADRSDADWSPDVHSAKIQRGPLAKILRARMILPFVALFFAALNPWATLMILLVSEISERQLFFQSVYSPKMPGNFGGTGSH
jgi:formate dehydrogenase iron-sulfur subunit